MNIIQCNQNHYYDAEKFLTCPHCANAQSHIRKEDLLGKNQQKIRTVIPHSDILPGQPQMRRKTVGWLVCIAGAMLGESFCLREGENHIGRTANMDVPLLHEPTVSRESHAVITYDTARHVCILYARKHAPQTFCNERTVKIKKTLKNRDIIRFGTCSLVFIPFCNSSFSWPSDPEV